MAEKKAATRKRRTTTRRKKPKATKSASESVKTTADETAEQEKPTALRQSDTPQSAKGAAGARRQRGTRRAKKKAASSDAAVKPSSTSQSTRKSTARRRAPKRRRSKALTEAPSAEPAPAPPPVTLVKAISPSAEVLQEKDTIVIRFPAVGQEAPPAAEEAVSEAGRDEAVIEPPIDWEPAEEPALVEADQEARADELFAGGAVEGVAARPTEAEESPEAPVATDDAKQVRPKRRRKRKRDPRTVPEAKAPSEEKPAPEEERQRPEPVPEPTETAEAAVEEKPARRRRRRPRRGRKPEARPADAAEAPNAAAQGKRVEREETDEPTAPPGEKEMIINVVPHEECRIAIMEKGKLQEIYLERASAEHYVGNIYKGIVTNVEPSIQAAFIDFGMGKNGFLHISDLHPQYFPSGEGHTEDVGRKTPRRSRPPIQRCLRRNQKLLVQITKEGIGTKGPTLTTYLSIPGRFLVMMPGMRQLGVSRKIEDEEVRRKLRGLLHELNLPEDMGFIARTAALDRTKRELQGDLNYLSRLWKAVEKRIKNGKAPAEIYTESDLVIRTIRDVYTPDINCIHVDDPEVAQRAHEFLSIFSPRSRDTVVEYDKPEPIFHRYGIEAELDRLHSRHVPLKSGGSLVIDQTEALVAVDVNSGRFRTEDDAETTAYKINLEAADEIPRQLRLRDLGGVVICDFIDMRQEKHKREIERRLSRNLKEHKERAKILRMSAFGIIEMTRQRQRASLTRSVYQDCHHCRGTGLVKTAESVALDVMRLVQLAVAREHIRKIEVSVSAEVADLLQNRRRAQLHQLEAKNARSISVRAEPNFGLDQIAIQCYDPRERIVPHP